MSSDYAFITIRISRCLLDDAASNEAIRNLMVETAKEDMELAIDQAIREERCRNATPPMEE